MTDHVHDGSDPDCDRCIHCAADTNNHTSWCPFTTGVWPVDKGMADALCVRCDAQFAPGEHYAVLPVVGDVGAVVCLGCAALGEPISEGDA